MPPPTSVSAEGIDKNSRLADTTPNIKFFSPDKYDFPVIAFNCTNAVGTILWRVVEFAKRWLLSQYNSAFYGGPEILRMEKQEVEKVKHWEEGTLLLLEHACWIEGQEGKVPVRIMALVMPKDPRVRFWYSAIASFKGLLLRLDEEGFIHPKRTFEPKIDKHHRRLYVWMRDAFMEAMEVPHHPDYLNAITVRSLPPDPSNNLANAPTQLTDYSPPIAHPSTSLRAIESCEPLYTSTKDPPLDLSTDRYIHALAPPEREIASQVQLTCSAYLLVKRNFFQAWWVDVYRSDKKVKDGENVRTNYAHEQWLEKMYEWSRSRCKRLVAGWRVLGLLEQGRLVPWVLSGGMLVDDVRAMEVVEEDGDGEGVMGEEEGAGKTVGRPRRA
ncbi:hypothetical protein PRZ48_000643 [Zasmidium cellare]|uniref:Uncharacterized protein n=1 Tax=Zasmidium cellare TaxID=395010 RepID=A0ABR0F0Q7_ZASCE|nr:hypothetical protein PRZ48_000643 [Zasmidium cellare]